MRTLASASAHLIGRSASIAEPMADGIPKAADVHATPSVKQRLLVLARKFLIHRSTFAIATALRTHLVQDMRI